MTQEEKRLLLIDLSARIPYRTLVCLNPGAYNKPETCILTGVDGEQVYLNVDSDPFRVDHIKPYLRPMSSMTEEEKIFYEYHKEGLCSAGWAYALVDWLNENHFDYRGLIEKGLAIAATKDMYTTNL